MDIQQEEIQFLGLLGIFNCSYKIIITWRKIFTKITLTLILPLTIIFLAHIKISDTLFEDIRFTEIEKKLTKHGTKRYNNLSDKLTAEWIEFLLFKIAYFTILLVLSLLSTAAVVYTVASVYTQHESTFKKVMTVVPRVWKRLMVTFVCMFATFFVYNSLMILVMTIFCNVLPYNLLGELLMFTFSAIYGTGFAYMALIWQLASVVSVLESAYGIKAVTKSNYLIKGNRDVAFLYFLLLSTSYFLIQLGFELFVVDGGLLGLEGWKRVGFGVLSFVLLLTFFLFGLVSQTILYLVCKAYHHENIDKEDLSNRLESYLGEYEALNWKKEVEVEEYDHV